MVLGDNIIEGNIIQAVKDYQAQPSGAKIMLKKVPDPERFGVPEIDADGKLIQVEEKPAEPKSPYAVIGIYMYDSDVFNIISTLKPSRRNELEITDVNNAYLRRGDLTWSELKGWWHDAGTFDSLIRVGGMVKESGANKLEL